MRSVKFIVPLFTSIFIIAAALLADDHLIPPDLKKANMISATAHPRAQVINLVLKNLERAPKVEPTGLTRDDYLKFVDGQVRVMRRFQDDQGRIIDPVIKKEVQYATPCYAHAISVLAKAGELTDADLIESGMLAMDRAVLAMVTNNAPDHHGDFFTWPVMLALTAFKDVAPADRWEKWKSDLAKIDPSKLYNFYNNRQSLNWVLVHTAGEFLRYKSDMTDLTYIDAMIAKQAHHFTADGMYSEGGQPMAYDLFSRLFVTGMLENGYEGKHLDFLRDSNWRGAWMTLLMQSPTGEAPTGHRSSQHIWLEAEQSAILEAYATALKKAGRESEARIFKRAARLSLHTLLQWVRPDGSGYVVKNKFPIDARHGYEGYSSYTQYNLLACSMVVQAYASADETIEESAAPADVGGYVLPVLYPFHKVFASAGGAYVEYETRGDTDDRKWLPCGVVRIHFKAANSQLGPSDGISIYQNKNADAPDYAVGPEWLDASGKWTRLASLRPKDNPTVQIIEQSAAKAVFSISYKLDAVNVTQKITVESGQVTFEDRITGASVEKIRAYLPMLIDDGQEKTQVAMDARSAVLRKTTGGPIRFEVLNDDASELVRTNLQLNHRNGIAEPVFAERVGNTIRYRVSTP